MSSMDHGDGDFERTLLQSASGDAPLAGACDRAWSRFRAAMAIASMTQPLSRGGSAPMGEGKPVGWLARAVSKATWWLLGAITGSAVTWAVVGRPVVRRVVPAAVVPAATTSPATAAPPSARPAQGGDVLGEPRGAPSAVSSTPPAGGVAESTSVRGKAARREVSSLAAEVAALDRARGALDSGRTDDALALLGHYLGDFPKGKLVPEAQVMRIEALAAQGDRARVAGEADRFLERFPNAPQKARIEKLRAEAGRE